MPELNSPSTLECERSSLGDDIQDPQWPFLQDYDQKYDVVLLLKSLASHQPICHKNKSKRIFNIQHSTFNLHHKQIGTEIK